MAIDIVKKRTDGEIAREIASALLDYEVSTGVSQTYRLLSAVFSNLNIDLDAACQGVGQVGGKDAVKEYAKVAGVSPDAWEECAACNDEMPMQRGNLTGRAFCLWCILPVDIDPNVRKAG